MAELHIENMTVNVDDLALVKNASMRVSGGELVILLGPNGAGKTTLLRAALGLLPLEAGHARIDGAAVHTLSPEARARRISYLPQQRTLAWPNRVVDIVALGRFAYGAAMGRLSDEDQRAVSEALAACDLLDLQARRMDTLSGGEQARVHFARVLAARTPLLIADEPAASLDPRHQFRIMQEIRRFVEQGGGALLVLHDISLAARFADRIVLMKEAEILADGPVETVLTADRLADIYGVSAQIEGRHIRLEGLAP